VSVAEIVTAAKALLQGHEAQTPAPRRHR
jgi:hypothetical protein